MKRSDFYIKLTTALLFLAVLCFVVVLIYNATVKTYETTDAMRYSIEDTASTYGYIVRTEIILADTGNVVLPFVNEGEKVASGQVIAAEYMSSEALEVASEIRTLRLLIAGLEASDGDSSVETASLRSIIDLSRAVQQRDFSKLEELTLNVETYVFSAGSSLASDLPAMKRRLESLEARVSGVRSIDAPVSGTFSQVVDGFESVTPDALIDILPTGLDELFSSPSQVASGVKLVTEFKWYYAAIMRASDVSRLSEGSQATIQFSGAYRESIDMLVEHIGRRENDDCVVLFSSSRNLHEIVSHRELRADIVFSVVSGIRVPKEAIQLDDYGVIFIYLQTGVRAERVDVEILAESGDSYIVRDGVETGLPLRVGSTIIVRANGLFDGKIVG